MGFHGIWSVQAHYLDLWGPIPSEPVIFDFLLYMCLILYWPKWNDGRMDRLHSNITPKKAGKANRIRAVSRFLAGRFSYLRGIVSDFPYLRGFTIQKNAAFFTSEQCHSSCVPFLRREIS